VFSIVFVQVVITLLLISVQIVGATIWLILEPPGVRPYHPFDRKDQVSSVDSRHFLSLLKCLVQISNSARYCIYFNPHVCIKQHSVTYESK